MVQHDPAFHRPQNVDAAADLEPKLQLGKLPAGTGSGPKQGEWEFSLSDFLLRNWILALLKETTAQMQQNQKTKSHQLSADQKLITNDQQSIKNDQLQMVSGKLLFWLRFIENWLRINEKWLKCLIDKPNFIDQLHKWKKVN